MDVEQEITAELHVTSLDFILSMVEVILQQVELVILDGISLLIVEHAANALGSNITGRKEDGFIGKTLEILLTTLNVIQITTEAPVNVILLAELVTGRLAVLIIIPGIEHDSFKNLKHLRLHHFIGTLRRSGCQGSTVLKVGERIGLTSSRNLLNILRSSYLLLLSRVIVHLVRHTCIYDGTKEVGIDTQTYQCLLTVFLIIETLTGDTIERVQEVALLSKNLRLIHVIKAVNGRINLLTQILIRHSSPLFNQMTDGIQRKVGMPVDTIVIQSLTGLSSLSFLLTITVGMVILLISKNIELLTDAVRQRGRVDLTVHLSQTLTGSEDNLVVLMNHITVSVLGSLGFQPLLIVNTGLLQVHHLLDPFLCLLTLGESTLCISRTDQMVTTPGTTMNVTTFTPATGIGCLAHLGEANKIQYLTVKGNLMVTAFLVNLIDRLLLLGKRLYSLIKAGLDLLVKLLHIMLQGCKLLLLGPCLACNTLVLADILGNLPVALLILSDIRRNLIKCLHTVAHSTQTVILAHGKVTIIELILIMTLNIETVACKDVLFLRIVIHIYAVNNEWETIDFTNLSVLVADSTTGILKLAAHTLNVILSVRGELRLIHHHKTWQGDTVLTTLDD